MNIIQKELIDKLISYAWPGRDRGPAHPDWLKMMKAVAEYMEWEVCSKCKGEGKVGVNSAYRTRDCCTMCYGIGKVKSEE